MAYYLENLYKPNPDNPVKQALSARHNFRIIMNRLNDLIVLVEATTLGITAGSNNLALGSGALSSVTTGYSNTAFGYQALYKNTEGYDNVAIGYQALYENLSGHLNTGLGHQSLYDNTSGHLNVSIGYRTLYNNTTGDGNVAVGFEALYSNTSGLTNIAIGYRALYSSIDEAYNVAIGYQALYSNTIGHSNIAIGHDAGRYETGSNTFYVNNQDRTNIAGDKAESLLYGVMAAAVADQKLTINGLFNLSVSKTPASAAAAGTAGDMCWDTSYIYVCTAADTWERIGIASW